MLDPGDRELARMRRDATGSAGLLALVANARELLDLAVHHENFVALRDRAVREGRVVQAQLVRGVVISSLSVGIGLMVGAAGVSMANQFPSVASIIKGAGLALRYFGTGWAVLWLGVVLLKATTVVQGLRMTSEGLNELRRRFCNALPGSPLATALSSDIPLISENTAARLKNGFLSVYLWITLVGVLTLVPSFLGTEVTPGAYALLVLLSLVILLVSLARGADFVRFAWVIYIGLVGVILFYLAARSPVGTYVASVYYESGYYKEKVEHERRVARDEAKRRILRGHQRPSDREILGPAYDDLVRIHFIETKDHPDDCDRLAVQRLEQRADARLSGRSVMVDVPDCDQRRELEARAAAAQQKRQSAYSRVLAGRQYERRGDRTILGALYAEAVEVRLLGSKPDLDDCHSARLNKLKMRLALFIQGSEFAEVLLAVCPDPPAAQFEASKVQASLPADVDRRRAQAQAAADYEEAVAAAAAEMTLRDLGIDP